MAQLAKNDIKDVLNEMGVVTKDVLKKELAEVVTEKVLKRELNKTTRKLQVAIARVSGFEAFAN